MLESTAGYKKPSKEKVISFLPLLRFPALPHPFMTFTDWQPTTAEIPALAHSISHMMLQSSTSQLHQLVAGPNTA